MSEEVANSVGKHRNTILTWLKAGKIPEVHRDVNGWRFWTEEDLKRVYEYATEVLPPSQNKRRAPLKEGADFSPPGTADSPAGTYPERGDERALV